jgi:propanol-preferring alcohol dehydrogenase
MMRAWRLARPGPIASGPLELVTEEPPVPGPKEVRVAVTACGVCRTDLHIVEGDLPQHRPRVVPGHEVVGVVDALGPGATRFGLGERIGIAWLRSTCGTCSFCRRGNENLCERPLFTGWDADGGYATHALAPEAYAYALPAGIDDEHAAPLLCAGIIGYRALARAAPPPGGRLGLYGFGGSAHLAAQVALAQGLEVHVVTRSERARALALELGAASARSPADPPPTRLDAAVLFAPSGELVPAALTALAPGGRLAIAGIHLTPIPALELEAHLSHERELVSVTANTRADGNEFLELAARIGIDVRTAAYGLDHAPDALADLAAGRVTGAAVLLAP